jgi:hypothetical protein
LAAILPGDIITDFWLVNLAAALVSIGLLYAYLQLVLRSQPVSLLLTCPICRSLAGAAAVRVLLPDLCRPWGIVFVLAGLIAARKLGNNPSLAGLAAFGLLAFVGALLGKCCLHSNRLRRRHMAERAAAGP